MPDKQYDYIVYKYPASPPILLEEAGLYAYQVKRNKLWNRFVRLDQDIKAGRVELLERDTKIKHIRNTCELWWPDFTDVMRGYNAARKKIKPRLPGKQPVNIEDIGTVRFYQYIRRPLYAPLLHAGAYEHFSIIQYNDNREPYTQNLGQGWVLGRFRHRISQNPSDSMELLVPIRWYRELPEDTPIREIILTRLSERGKLRWFVLFSLRIDLSQIQHQSHPEVLITFEPDFVSAKQERLDVLSEAIRRKRCSAATEREYFALSSKIARQRKSHLIELATRIAKEAKIHRKNLRIGHNLSELWTKTLEGAARKHRVKILRET